MPSSTPPSSDGSGREVDPDLSPVTSPDHPERVAPAMVGTRRINQRPMLIVFVLVTLFAVVCVAVMYSRSQRQVQRHTDEHTSASRQAEGLIPKGPAWTPTAPEAAPPRPVRLAAPPLPTPPPVPAPQPTPDALEVSRLQALQAALNSKPAVEGLSVASRPGGPGNGADDRPDPEVQRLAALRALFGHDGQQDRPGAAPAALPVSARADFSGLGQFDAGSDPNRWRSNATIENPGRFTLRTGAVIPGVLISGVNSDLPGTIIAQVSQNVYDTPTGGYLLLPQGSRLIGAYSANVAYGQSRVFIAWQRVIYPDGRALDIGAQPGTDGGGYAGFADQVDNHYARVFGSAVLMSAIVGGVAYSQQLGQNTPNPNNGTLSNSASGQNGLTQALSQSLGVTFGNVITNLIQKNLNIAPTLKLRPGYRFNILVVKDFYLTPYVDFQFGRTEHTTAAPPVIPRIRTITPSPFDK